MSDTRPSIDAWLEEIKNQPGSEGVGIFLLQVGVVRGTTREGLPVTKIEMTNDPSKLIDAVTEAGSAQGVFDARAWVNQGTLNVGDDMLCALVAGDTRPNTLAAWQELARKLKEDVITYQEQ